MLRTRLVLGLLCLLAILLAMGLYSIDRCGQLGKEIQMILNQNFEIVRAVQQIKQSVAQTTAALLANDGRSQLWSIADFEKACASLEKSLNTRSVEAETRELRKTTAELQKVFESYRQNGRDFVRLTLKQKAERTVLAQRLGKETARLMELSDQVLVENQAKVQERNSDSEGKINETIRRLLLGMIIAIIVAIYTSFRLTRSVLEPISTLTASIRKVGEGNLEQHLGTQSSDEMGVLVQSFNTMARQLKAYREASTGKLARLDRTLQQTIASFPDPIFVLNHDGEVEFRNPPADALAVKLLFAGVKRLPEEVETLVAKVRSGSQDFRPTLLKDAIRFHFDHKDHYYLPRVVSLRTEPGEAFGVAVILEDITQVLLLDELKSNLIGTVSHELKTPLTSLRMALYLMMEKTLGDLNSEQTHLISSARQDADRLLSTLNDLLDLSKLEEGLPQLNRLPVLPQVLLQDAMDQIREYPGVSAERVVLEFPPGLPLVSVDRLRMSHVFNNLLTNAIKYSTPGAAIRAIARLTEDGEVEFSIVDQGEGIPLEHQNHIFEKFYRVPGTSRAGSGLGLSIAREIVRAHGGTIGVRSEAGKGSEFFVILPALS